MIQKKRVENIKKMEEVDQYFRNKVTKKEVALVPSERGKRELMIFLNKQLLF